jgi:predicted DNA-binding transcriptional regulator AlpA
MNGKAPTLAQVRKWPPTVSVTRAAAPLGVSRASAYTAIAEGTFPAQVITVSKRMKVLTSSLIRVLEGGDGRAAGPA